MKLANWQIALMLRYGVAPDSPGSRSFLEGVSKHGRAKKQSPKKKKRKKKKRKASEKSRRRNRGK